MVNLKIYNKNIETGCGIHDFVSICSVDPKNVEKEIAWFANIGIHAEVEV